MKHFLTLLLFLLTFTWANAQPPQRDVVYLKNGSIIRGMVIEMTTGESIRIRTADGSILVYPSDQVERIEKEHDYNPFLLHRYSESDSTANLRQRGYQGSVEGGVCDYFSGGEIKGSFLTTHGALLSHKFFIGAGCGYDSGFGVVYAAARSYFSPKEKGCNPYFETKLGYAWRKTDWIESDFSEWEEHIHGAYISPSLCLSFPFGPRKAAITAGIVYSAFINSENYCHSLGLRMGFTF